MQDLLPDLLLSVRNRPAWRTKGGRLKARRCFLVKFFIDLLRVKRGNKKKAGGPAWSSRFMENVAGLTNVANDFDIAG